MSVIPSKERIGADLTALAEFAESAQPGWTRRVFSEAYLASREFTRRRMEDAGLETSVDAAGNIIGRLAGEHPALPVLMTGSHTDTVRGGGRYDGIVGVLGGIEAVRALRESGTRLQRDLLVVDFLGEEANIYGYSCLGSRAIAGSLTAAHLDRTDEFGGSMGQAMAGFGLDPSAALNQGWRRGDIHGYVELHIEQGPLLENSGHQIGVVTAIAGIERLLASFYGRPDHAGTTPMNSRADALLAAAEAVLTIEREACGAPVHGVSTTGRIESLPGAMNVVSNEAKVWAEVRSVDPGWLSGSRRRLAERIAEQASTRGVDTALEWLNDQAPVQADREVHDLIASAAEKLGFSWDAVPSGAGHDAAHIAGIAPMGMIFVPSVGGRSHVPEEFTELVDIERGTAVLATTLLDMDRRDRVTGIAL